MSDSIVALASGHGRAGVAVIRLSGPQARPVLARLAGRVPEPRRATLVPLADRPGGETIDEALVLFFPGPASFTGEDVAEFHVHGGRAVITAVLDALTRGAGVRLAEPGEFSRRAVENGRMDLTAAEGVADLVAAETAAQRRQALRQTGGVLEKAAEAWRARLLRAMALLEAEIDFPDEGDVPALLAAVRAETRVIAEEIDAALAAAVHGERLREGAVVVIAGPPNAGKSTLMNALARREVAIVSEHAGTTRDLLEVQLDLAGLPVRLVDTAGLRDSADPVEQAGVERARQAAARADLILWLEAPDAGLEPPRGLTAPVVRVAAKADLGRMPQDSADLAVSARSGEGMADLIERLRAAAETALEGAETALVTRLRHRREIEAVRDALARQDGLPAELVAPELLAEDLRLALRAVGRLTGRVDIDEVYDLIFREFCIGK
jgi:tRNA modification GTPase